jgi:hypothetical protein
MARSLNRAIRAWSASPSLSMGGGAARGHGSSRPSRRRSGHGGSQPRRSRAATVGPDGRSLVPTGGLASHRTRGSSGPPYSSSSTRRDRASNRWEGRPARGPGEEHGSRPDGEPRRPARTDDGLRPTRGSACVRPPTAPMAQGCEASVGGRGRRNGEWWVGGGGLEEWS